MMNLSGSAVAVSLILGSIRAAQLLRVSSRVEVVNAVVLTTLANGRGRDLPNVLASSGSALYLTVARAISEPLDKLLAGDRRELRQRLEREAHVALIVSSRKLKRFEWLDSLSLAAIIMAGVGAITAASTSAMLALGLLAATLLWLSNIYGARSIATRMFAGATALVDALIAGLEQIRAANATKPPAAGSSHTTR